MPFPPPSPALQAPPRAARGRDRGSSQLYRSVRNLRFEGAIRLMVVGLQSSEPGYGAILVSFPSAPKVGLDLTVAGGELTKLSWLRTEVQKVRPSASRARYPALALRRLAAQAPLS